MWQFNSIMRTQKANSMRRCAETGLKVRIDQSQSACRQQHGCEQYCCPLRYDFELDKLELMIAASGGHAGKL